MAHPLGSKYVLHELLGSGAMGQVFRGTVRDTGAQVAVKILKPELLSDPGLVARFFQERSILTAISHPNVVRVIDLVVEGDTAGIVMELVDGQDLRYQLLQRRTLPPAEAVGFVRQLLEGLSAVHAAGIVHRDVKPENLLLDVSLGEPELKLTDFGVARLSHGSALTKMTSVIGTPDYMAPEIAERGDATPAADLYSTGIVLYEMLAGRTPFRGGHPMAVLHRHMSEPPAPISGVPTELWAEISWLLEKDPRSRPASATEAADALGWLEPSLAGLPPLPPLPSMLSPAPYVDSGPRVGSGPRVSSGGRAYRARPAAADAGALGYQLTGPAEAAHPPTELRRQDPQGPPDPWGEYAPPAGSGQRPPLAGALAPPHTAPRKSRWRRSLPVASALTAAAAALAIVVTVLVSRSPQAASGATHPPVEPSYTFAPQMYPDGLLIVRRWTLSGERGSLLTETVSASSGTGRPLRVSFQDEIPAAVARTTQTVHFTPDPTRIIRADPVVGWKLRLPRQGTVMVGYRATVPAAGETQTRLMRLVKDFGLVQKTLRNRPRTIELRSLSIDPSSVQLEPGQSVRLKLTGRLRDGKAAPAAILGNAAWNPGNRAVASVASPGTVTGVAAGSTYVTAQIGGAHVSVPVTVAAAPDLVPESKRAAKTPTPGRSSTGVAGKKTPHSRTSTGGSSPTVTSTVTSTSTITSSPPIVNTTGPTTQSPATPPP